jgi:hypothetical protein
MILRAGVVRWQAGGFYGFLGPRMPEDAREWEKKGKAETGERMSEIGK